MWGLERRQRSFLDASSTLCRGIPEPLNCGPTWKQDGANKVKDRDIKDASHIQLLAIVDVFAMNVTNTCLQNMSQELIYGSPWSPPGLNRASSVLFGAFGELFRTFHTTCLFFKHIFQVIVTRVEILLLYPFWHRALESCTWDKTMWKSFLNSMSFWTVL